MVPSKAVTSLHVTITTSLPPPLARIVVPMNLHLATTIVSIKLLLEKTAVHMIPFVDKTLKLTESWNVVISAHHEENQLLKIHPYHH